MCGKKPDVSSLFKYFSTILWTLVPRLTALPLTISACSSPTRSFQALMASSDSSLKTVVILG